MNRLVRMTHWKGLALIAVGMAVSALSTMFSLMSYESQWTLIRSLNEDGVHYEFDILLWQSREWILFLASMGVVFTIIGAVVLYDETRRLRASRA